MGSKEHIEEEIRKKENKGAERRKHLRSSAQRVSRVRKRLNFTAAMLALVSSGTIVAVITNVAGDEVAQMVAAAIAFVSGVTSLTITWFYSEEDSQKMTEGASDFLKLRLRAQQLLNNAKLTEEELSEGHTELQTMYLDMDKKYVAFYPEDES